MPKRYVARSKVKLEPDDGSDSMQLIYGDEVESRSTSGTATKVRVRGRSGTLHSDSLDAEPVLECYFLDVGQGDATLIVAVSVSVS